MRTPGCLFLVVMASTVYAWHDWPVPRQRFEVYSALVAVRSIAAMGNHAYVSINPALVEK